MPTAAASSPSTLPNDRRARRRLLQALTSAAAADGVCDARTARLIRKHTTDPSAAYTLLRGIAQRCAPRRRDLYEAHLSSGECAGAFARRERWDRRRVAGKRHPAVRWGPGIFPDVRPTGDNFRSSATPVEPSRLQQAIAIASAVVAEEQQAIELAFRVYVTQQRHGRPPDAVEAQTARAVQRLQRATLGLPEENPARMDATSYRRCFVYVYGESYEDGSIFVSRTAPMSFEDLVHTLIHEVRARTRLGD